MVEGTEDGWQSTTGELSWRHWDDLSVVFCSDSGETHVLDPLTAWLLNLVVTRSVSFSQILAAAAELDLDVDTANTRKRLRGSLDRLVCLDLIEPAVEGT